MFCEKCGKPTEGEQTLCAECAAQQAEVVCSEAPAQTEKPVQPVDVTEAPTHIDDTFELNTAESVPATKAPKKKTGLIAGIIAVVAAAAIGIVTWLNWGSVESFIGRSVKSPEDYLADVESQAIAEYTADLTKAYGKWRNNANMTAGKGTINLTLGDEVLSLVEMALQQQGAPMDLDWLSNITLSMEGNVQDDAIQAIIGLGLGKQNLLSLDSILDLKNGMTYVAIPELNDQYLSAEIPPELDTDVFQEAFSLGMEASRELIEDLPSEQELNKMINTYVGIVLSKIKNVEKDTQTISVGDASQKMVILTAKITQKDLLEIAEAVLKEAENDKTLEKFINALGTYVNTINSADYYEPVDLYEEFTAAIPDLLDELEYMKEDADSGNYLKLNVYVDMQNNIRGHKLTVYTEGEEEDLDIYWLSAKKGDTIYTEAQLGELEITGEQAENNGVSDGKFVFSMYDEEAFTVEFKDVTDTTATIRFVPGEAFTEGLLRGAQLPSSFFSGNLALELVGGTQSDPNYVALNILMGNNTLIGLDVSSQPSSGGSISIPTNVLNVNNQTDVMQWLKNADFDAVLDALENANVPDEIVSIARSYIDMLMQYIG